MKRGGISTASFLFKTMSFPRKVVSVTGVMPDGALPKTSSNTDPTSVFLYYRTDGQLYLYDLRYKQEFDLFNMPIDNVGLACRFNPFGV